MKKIFAILVAAIMCVTLFAACGEKKGEETPATETPAADFSKVNKEMNDVIVAEVSGIKFTQAYYNLIYCLTFENKVQQEQGSLDWLELIDEEGKSGIDGLKKGVEDEIAQIALIQTIAEENGVVLTEEMKAQAEQAAAQALANSGEELLTGLHTTEAAVKQYFEIQYLVEALVTKLSEEGGPGHLTDEDIKEIDEMFNADFADKLRVQHILIQITDAQTGETVRSEKDALKLANEVIKNLDEGADFDSLIPDYNEDPGMATGQYYTFGAGEMVPEFEEASKALEIGQYTKTPVKSDYGYHVIKRYAVDKTIPEYEEYKAYVQNAKVGEFIVGKVEGVERKMENESIDKFIEEYIQEQKKLYEESMNAAAENATTGATAENATTGAAAN